MLHSIERVGGKPHYAAGARSKSMILVLHLFLYLRKVQGSNPCVHAYFSRLMEFRPAETLTFNPRNFDHKFGLHGATHLFGTETFQQKALRRTIVAQPNYLIVLSHYDNKEQRNDSLGQKLSDNYKNIG